MPLAWTFLKSQTTKYTVHVVHSVSEGRDNYLPSLTYFNLGRHRKVYVDLFVFLLVRVYPRTRSLGAEKKSKIPLPNLRYDPLCPAPRLVLSSSQFISQSRIHLSNWYSVTESAWVLAYLELTKRRNSRGRSLTRAGAASNA